MKSLLLIPMYTLLIFGYLIYYSMLGLLWLCGAFLFIIFSPILIPICLIFNKKSA